MMNKCKLGTGRHGDIKTPFNIWRSSGDNYKLRSRWKDDHMGNDSGKNSSKELKRKEAELT